MVFDRDSPAYRSCCCHARACTIAIGIIEMIWLILVLVLQGYGYARSRAITFEFKNVSQIASDNTSFYGFKFTGNSNVVAPSAGPLGGSIAAFVIVLICVILLFVAICKENHIFLIPHLIMQIAGLIGLIVGIIMVILSVLGVGLVLALLFGGSVIIVASIFCVLLAIVFFLEIWFFVVVLRCYRFFRDQADAGMGAGMQMASAGHYYKS